MTKTDIKDLETVEETENEVEEAKSNKPLKKVLIGAGIITGVGAVARIIYVKTGLQKKHFAKVAKKLSANGYTVYDNETGEIITNDKVEVIDNEEN